VSAPSGPCPHRGGRDALDGGGLTISGQVNLTGNGVMIYNNPHVSTDSINISGQGAINLSPLTTGTYMGLTLIRPHRPVHRRGPGPADYQRDDLDHHLRGRPAGELSLTGEPGA
jgi:hypothetical protein